MAFTDKSILLGESIILSYSWIIPIGDTEASHDIIRCFNSLVKILDPLDQVIIVRHPIDMNLIDPMILRFKCLSTIIDHPETRTAAAARNAALQHSKYRKIIFQDIDDVPHLNRREVIDDNLCSPGMIMTTGYQSFIDGKKNGPRLPKPFSCIFYFRSNIFLPTAAIYLKENHTINFENLKVGEDTVFFARLLHENYRVIYIRICTIDYHISTSKVLNKGGLNGVINEIKYRKYLLHYSRSLFQKYMVVTGGVFFVALKLLPAKIFKILYNRGHTSE